MGQGLSIKRGGHGHQSQIRNQKLASLPGKGQGQIAANATFMHLIKENRADTAQGRILLQQA